MSVCLSDLGGVKIHGIKAHVQVGVTHLPSRQRVKAGCFLALRVPQTLDSSSRCEEL